MSQQNIVALAQEFYDLDEKIPECNNRTLGSIIKQFLDLDPPSNILSQIREVIKSNDVKVFAKEIYTWCQMSEMLDDMRGL